MAETLGRYANQVVAVMATAGQREASKGLVLHYHISEGNVIKLNY